MNHKELINYLTEKCKKSGVTDYEIFCEKSFKTFIKTSRMVLERVSYQTEKGVNVRVFNGKKTSSFYSCDFTPETIDELLNRALKLTNILEEDEYAVLPTPTKESSMDLGIHDPTFENTCLEDKISLVLSMESEAESFDSRIVTHFNVFQESIREIQVINSRGFNQSYRSTTGMLYCSAVTKSEKVGTRIDIMDSSRHYKMLANSNIGKKAAEKAVILISNARVKTTKMPVIFEPEMSCYLLHFFANALSAENVQRKQSFLEGKIGHKIAHDSVTLVDDGLIPGQIGTIPFDSEGNYPVRTTLVSNGKCMSYLYDEKTARKAGTRSTGNAFRQSYRHPMVIQPKNFFMEPGTTQPETILKDVEHGLLLLSMINTGGVNIISGEFSVQARGILVKNGQKTTPLNNLVISSTLTQMLNNIRYICNDFTWHDRYGAPTILIDDMVVSS